MQSDQHLRCLYSTIHLVSLFNFSRHFLFSVVEEACLKRKMKTGRFICNEAQIDSHNDESTYCHVRPHRHCKFGKSIAVFITCSMLVFSVFQAVDRL